MQGFVEFLTEGSAKNLHLEHLEDEILNTGFEGGRSAINFLRSLRDMLAGKTSSKVDVTVKWDGAPAIFCGIDPEDGQFFVGTKAVFSKTAKLIKHEGDLDYYGISGGLASKLRIALRELSSLGITNVLQGDMMFTREDIQNTTIDGEKYITFQPNTIVYAIPENSELAEKMLISNIGIVFHTTYEGSSLPDMNASFGADVSGLRKTSNVWYQSAEYPDKSGSITMTSKETDIVTKLLSNAGKMFHKIDSGKYKIFMNQELAYPSNAIGSKLKTFYNSKIRSGKIVKNPNSHISQYIQYFDKFWEDKVIGKVKREESKRMKRNQKDQYLDTIVSTRKTLESVISFQGFLVEAKNLIVDKLNKGAKADTGTFIRTKNGYKVVNPEGFVAIDKDGSAVKLVDRLEFSFNNFNVEKTWDK